MLITKSHLLDFLNEIFLQNLSSMKNNLKQYDQNFSCHNFFYYEKLLTI